MCEILLRFFKFYFVLIYVNNFKLLIIFHNLYSYFFI